MTQRPVSNHLIARLIQVLSEEMQLYNELLLVLRQKQASIIEGKMEDLQSAIQAEQSLLNRASDVAQTRKASFAEVQKEIGEEVAVKTIARLIELAESTYAERLGEIHIGLKKIAADVMLVNEENRYLLNYSIKFVRQAARELIRTSDQFPVYTATGVDSVGDNRTGLVKGTV